MPLKMMFQPDLLQSVVVVAVVALHDHPLLLLLRLLVPHELYLIMLDFWNSMGLAW